LPSVAERILIIKKELPLEGEFTMALIEAGFSLACVPDYTEALFSLDVLKPDMIILNHTSEDSMEMCRQLHAAFDTPIVLLGEDSDPNTWQRAVQAGADFYLTKPLKYGETIARVKALLRRYKDKGR